MTALLVKGSTLQMSRIQSSVSAQRRNVVPHSSHDSRRHTIPALHPTPSARASIFQDVRVLMITVTGFCVFLNVYATQTLLPLFSQIFAATKFHVSLTVSATTIGIALGAPLLGLLAERIGRKQTMAWSVALLTLPVLLSATATSLNALIAWRFVQGLIMPGIIAVTMAYISEEWAIGGAAAVMAAYVAGNVLGGVTGRFLSGVVGDHLGWRWAFLVLGTLNGIGAALVWLYLPHSRHAPERKRVRSSIADMACHFRSPTIFATFAAGMAALFALVATFTYITFYLAGAPFFLRTSALGSLFLVYFVGVVVTPVAGTWIDHFGHRNALVGAAIAAAAGVLLTLGHSLILVVAGLAVCSTAIFVCQAAAASYLGHIAGRAKASAAGLYTTFYYLGGTLGASLPALAWSMGGWPGCVAVIVLALLVAGGLALRFWHPLGSTPVPEMSSPHPVGTVLPA